MRGNFQHSTLIWIFRSFPINDISDISANAVHMDESRFPTRTSNEYEYEYGLIRYNAMWILDN